MKAEYKKPEIRIVEVNLQDSTLIVSSLFGGEGAGIGGVTDQFDVRGMYGWDDNDLWDEE